MVGVSCQKGGGPPRPTCIHPCVSGTITIMPALCIIVVRCDSKQHYYCYFTGNKTNKRAPCQCHDMEKFLGFLKWGSWHILANEMSFESSNKTILLFVKWNKVPYFKKFKGLGANCTGPVTSAWYMSVVHYFSYIMIEYLNYLWSPRILS